MSEDPGVSRSGRVRKKSSKLSDYQSTEAGEHRAAKRPAKSSPLHTTLTPNKTSQLGEQPPDLLLEDEEAAGVFVEAGVEMDLNFEQSLDIEVNVREEEVGEDDPDSDSDPELIQDAPRTEIIKKPDNLPVAAKRPRRDKSEVTAFSLWAQETRASVLASEPSLDSVQVTSRLREMWTSVPSQEKFSWKRRARSGLLQNTESQQSVVRTVTRVREAEPQQTLDMAAHLTLLGESLR